jgi:hypothetical protein
MATPPDFVNATALDASSLNAIGLWKIANGTLTNQGTVNFQGVFTSDFNVYKLFFYNVRNTTGGGEIVLRLLSGSTPASGAGTYIVQRMFAQGASVGGNRTAQSYARASFMFSGANSLTSGEVTIYAPNLAKRTSFQSSANYVDNVPDPNFENNFTQHNQTTAYDGIQVVGTDTFLEGTVQIYGVRL